jgi:hypothetical protein
VIELLFTVSHLLLFRVAGSLEGILVEPYEVYEPNEGQEKEPGLLNRKNKVKS